MDITEDMKNPNPEEKSNFCSALFFSHTIGMFWKGYRKPLDLEDLYNTLEKNKSTYLGDKLERNWKNHLAQCRKSNKKPSLLKVVAKIFWLKIVILGIAVFSYDIILRMMEPPLLGKLIEYFKPGSTMPLEEALIYASAIVLVNFCTTILLTQRIYLAQRLGLQAQTAFCSMISRKSLRISRKALKDTETGKLVNLLSNDVSRLARVTLCIHALWVSPLSGIIAMYYLWYYAGISGIFGLVPVIFIVIFQVYTGRQLSKFRLQTALKTDERVRLMDEIISGIQVIKMYAWEIPFEKLIKTLRIKELKIIKKSLYVRGIFRTLVIFTSRFALFTSLLLLVLTGQSIEASVVYVLMSYYHVIGKQFAGLFVRSFGEVVEFLAALQRIQDFFMNEEFENSTNIKNNLNMDSDSAVILKELCVSWDSNDSDTYLHNISCTIPKGQIIGVIGNVGCGKTCFLESLLGQTFISSGDISINGSMSYASQESWLFPTTIRQNIIFCEPFNRKKYDEVLRVCALEKDLESFENGDLTILGDKGASLSGGQKARINLARSIYRNADIYLLDDPLSAVDTHVGRHLYDECIKNYLKGKTVILVTHQVHYLIDADHILLINDGKIEKQGKFQSLANDSNEYYSKLFTDALENHENNYNNAKNILNKNKEISISKQNKFQTNGDLNEKVKIKTMQEEITNIKIEENIFFKYLNSGGGWCLTIFVIGMFAFSQVVISSTDYYVSIWVNIEEVRNSTNNEEEKENLISTKWCLYIYSILIAILLFVTLMTTVFFFNLSIKSSKNLHNNMFKSITYTVMRFFDTNPSGRILNRFAKDLGSIDESLPLSITETVQALLLVVGMFATISIINPIFLIPICFLTIIFYIMRNIYLRTSKCLRKLEATTKSPIFTHIGTTMKGLSVIRAFNAQKILQNEFDKHQDLYTSAAYMYISTYAAFGLYSEILCFIFRSFVTFSFFLAGETVFGDKVGLAITQASMITGSLQFGMKMSAEAENILVAVERLIEYSLLPEEKQPFIPKQPPKFWPENGKILFSNVRMRYASTLPLVLKNLTITINSQEKVGIVGRSGSGKSSLITALFRLAYVEGNIEVDSVDTETINLQLLRKNISIIPQDPVLFSGTLRYNLDPFEEYSDEVLYKAIKDVDLKDPTDSINKLEHRVLDRGTNYSTGQKQLICLARAIIRNNKILVLDEATANVDPQTDSFIQQTIRERFADCTILTVAHRLNTIIDSDKIIVMEDGTIKECDHPYQLLKNKEGIFYKMVENDGLLEQFTDIVTLNYNKNKKNK